MEPVAARRSRARQHPLHSDIRVGSEWKAAYHNETPIMDRNAPSPPAGAKKEEPKKETAAPASDPLTDSLMAVEKKGWDGWRTQDAKTLQENNRA